jgi:arylsulfatase A-like enzyme
VCAFANWPGKLAPRKHTSPLHVVDWFPTLAALVGYQPAADLKWDGVNQWPALTGAAGGNTPSDRTIYIAMNAGRMIRRGDWKLIAMNQGAPQLFNLAADPYEKQDLAATEAGRVAELQALLAAERAKDITELPADLVGLPK